MKKQCILSKLNDINIKTNKYIKKRIKEENLPILLNHVPIFYILPKDGSPLVFNEIASIWDISKSSLSDIINKYEKQGLLKKYECEADKRSIYISLEPQAVVIREKLEDIENEVLNMMLKDFDDKKKDCFGKNITQCLKNIRKML